jgi:hypothetical protein
MLCSVLYYRGCSQCGCYLVVNISFYPSQICLGFSTSPGYNSMGYCANEYSLVNTLGNALFFLAEHLGLSVTPRSELSKPLMHIAIVFLGIALAKPWTSVPTLSG